MVRVCTFEGCKTSARFNHVGEKKGKFCSKHKEAGMIDIVHPHCKVDGCTTLASFNISGQSRGEFCSQHKLVQNTSLPRLSACLTRNSVFNLHRSYLSESLHEGMVNVKHRQCAEPGCSTRPAFNWKGEEKGQFCNKHKEKGMVNVDRKEPRPGPGAKQPFAPALERTPPLMHGLIGISNKDEGEEGSEAPRKRGKASHPMQTGAPGEQQQQQQQQQQHPDYENVARLAQLPDMATLASADANGFVGMHALPYAHLAQSYAAVQSIPLVGDQTHSLGLPHQIGGHLQQHQLENNAAVPHSHGVVTVADMSQERSPVVHCSDPRLPFGDLDAYHSRAPMQAGVSQGKPSFAVASPSGTLGHVMLSHVIKFAREVMHPPAPGLSEDVHAKLCRYIDLFTVWDESKRVEQYSMLHFDWSVAKDNKVQTVCGKWWQVM
ncbi:hypothetical protein COCSUDRAFT_45656 [Coccomyxa subellipsoidea C-169]|uniref:EsV-1-7 n=1 Tax=Coccomyxa subellipsoidea (strain C-169) TaxID=574566 RepID=I0YI09_COCSC|nr:hypothetical protein COCSUDRAFT_45656 [Coccomyxa subellipsoidea C-169]EIE18028.1 hypothetical protein COCSUDRAFT_45656 [Coccomyxa subellipsoidea C-169]|eukprot:XP_005642572.1 hypothetical protein COCSUDRAFT_45656 [Coccomyxa subellipsoidea C-169]